MGMTRHELRREVFWIVFQNEFHTPEEMFSVAKAFLELRGESIEEQDEDYELPKCRMSAEDEIYIRDKAMDVIGHIDEYDAIINETVDGWKTSRMAKVDLALIRLAMYEIMVEQLPIGVAIDEAVSLSDEFGTDSSASFVNGALAKISKKLS